MSRKSQEELDATNKKYQAEIETLTRKSKEEYDEMTKKYQG
jgi:hypothetical protein